jgi:membrane fusion protein (multidrug efflux system)
MMGGRGPTPVVVVEAQTETFADDFSALGNAQSNESVDIIARVSSVVTTIHFAEGQRVKQGDLLIELDDREFAAELAVARADLDKAASQYRRSQSLGKTRVVSEAELDQLGADVRRAEADLRAAQVRLEHCSIRAPIDGIVGLRKVSPGDLVDSNVVITTLDDTSIIKLEFAIPETLLAKLELGMRVDAISTIYPDKQFVGKVLNTDSRVDPVTRSIIVVAGIPNPDQLIKPGMFMTANLTSSRDEVLLVPEQALAPRSGRQFLYVVSNDMAEEREVKIGARAPGLAEITAGLEPGELVIVEGIQKIRPGSPVTTTRITVAELN